MKSLWLLLIGALSIVILAEWILPAEEPPVPSYSKPGASGNTRVNLLAEADRTDDFPPMESYQSVKDRPLFFAGRRPPVESAPEAPKVVPKPVGRVQTPRASLSAVIRVGDNSYALLRGVGKGKGLLRVKLGGDVDGWKVETIQDDKVVLNNGSEKHEMPLRSYKAVALPRPKSASKTKKNGSRPQLKNKAVPTRRAGTKKEGG